jgi:hypothetical protein
VDQNNLVLQKVRDKKGVMGYLPRLFLDPLLLLDWGIFSILKNLRMAFLLILLTMCGARLLRGRTLSST